MIPSSTVSEDVYGIGSLYQKVQEKFNKETNQTDGSECPTTTSSVDWKENECPSSSSSFNWKEDKCSSTTAFNWKEDECSSTTSFNWIPNECSSSATTTSFNWIESENTNRSVDLDYISHLDKKNSTGKLKKKKMGRYYRNRNKKQGVGNAKEEKKKRLIQFVEARFPTMSVTVNNSNVNTPSPLVSKRPKCDINPYQPLASTSTISAAAATAPPEHCYNPYESILSQGGESYGVYNSHFSKEDGPEPYVPAMVTSYKTPEDTGYIFLTPKVEEPPKVNTKYRTQCYNSTSSSDEKVERVARTFVNDCLLSCDSSSSQSLDSKTGSSPPMYTYSSYKDFDNIMIDTRPDPSLLTVDSTEQESKEKTIQAPKRKRSRKSMTKKGGQGSPAVAAASSTSFQDKTPSKQKRASSTPKKIAQVKPQSQTVTVESNNLDVSVVEEGQIMDEGPSVIVVDLEEGEIQSEVELSPLKKLRDQEKLDNRRRRSKSRQKKRNSRSPIKKPASGEEITLIDGEGEGDDDCKLVAIVAPPKSKSPRKENFFSPKNNVRGGFGEVSQHMSRVNDFRRRSLNKIMNRQQSNSTKIDAKALIRSKLTPLKRLNKKSRWSDAKRSRWSDAKKSRWTDARKPIHTVEDPPNTRLAASANYSFLGTRSNIQLPVPLPLGNPRSIIIDGSNVAVGHGEQFGDRTEPVFSCRGLRICVNRIKEQLPYSEIVCFVPQYRHKKSKSADTHILDELRKEGILKYTPSREVENIRITAYDDEFILDYATEVKGIVISNDGYRDLYERNPEFRDTIRYRLLQFTWVNDYLKFSPRPLGRNGPDLNHFCRFSPTLTQQIAIEK